MKATNIVFCANGLHPEVRQIYVSDKVEFPIYCRLYKVEEVFLYEDGSVCFKLEGLERRWSANLFIPYLSSSNLRIEDTEGVVVENHDLIII